MKNKIKIMLGIIALTLVILILFITFKFSNKRTKNIAEENSDIVESNTTNEISNIDDIKEENNTINNSTASLEDEIKENEKQVEQPKTDNKPKTTNINTNKSSSNEKKQTTKPNTPTKEETNNNEIVKPTNSKNNPNNTTTPTKTEKPVEKPSIKKISQEEYRAEVNKVLQDIKSIRPGLKYVNKKCSAMQIFYPYRKEEIDIAIGGVSFGTVYYYIDIFVEGNQEKFKYYIGWEGN